MSLCRIRNCINLSLRMYHPNNKAFKKSFKYRKLKGIVNPGIQGKLKILEETSDKNDVLEEFADDEDYAEFESDLMGAAEVHKEHEWQIKQAKEKLKLQITKRKFIEIEKEPSFLTFTEKTEIHKLHKSDPHYWTVERLSESFPALPKTIHKVLRSKYFPKTVKRIQDYDNQVIQNWEKFRLGELAVDPMTEKHLKKFENRKISPADEEYIKEHILEPKIEFPTPKNSMFTSIIRDFMEKNNMISAQDSTDKMTKENDQIKLKDGDQKELIQLCDVNMLNAEANTVDSKKKSVFLRDMVHDKSLEKDYKVKHTSLVSQLKREQYSRQTFYEFIEKSVQENKDEFSPEAITMKDIYKRNILKAQEIKDEIHRSETSDTQSVSIIEDSPEENLGIEIQEHEKKQIINAEADEIEKGPLHTYVKSWVKLYEDETDYPMCIKIPKGRYVKGMTYRVKDCYYDDNGQFLYRVPGLKS